MSDSPASPTPPASTVQGLENSSNPETLDRVVATTTPRLWIALTAIVVLLVLGLAWAFLAWIPVRTTAPGMVLQPGARVVVPSPVAGSVTILQTLQTQVAAGEKVATVTPFDPAQPIVALKAPMAGIISDVLVQWGSGVDVGQAVFVISGTDTQPQVRVIALVPLSEVNTFKVGASVLVQELAVASAVDTSYTGTVTAVSSVPVAEADVSAFTGLELTASNVFSSNSEPNYMVIVMVPRDANGEEMLDGQLVNIVNTYATVHPIDFVLSGLS